MRSAVITTFLLICAAALILLLFSFLSSSSSSSSSSSTTKSALSQKQEKNAEKHQQEQEENSKNNNAKNNNTEEDEEANFAQSQKEKKFEMKKKQQFNFLTKSLVTISLIQVLHDDENGWKKEIPDDLASKLLNCDSRLNEGFGWNFETQKCEKLNGLSTEKAEKEQDQEEEEEEKKQELVCDVEKNQNENKEDKANLFSSSSFSDSRSNLLNQISSVVQKKLSSNDTKKKKKKKVAKQIRTISQNYADFFFLTSWLFRRWDFFKPLPVLRSSTSSSSSASFRYRAYHDEKSENIFRVENFCISPFNGLFAYSPFPVSSSSSSSSSETSSSSSSSSYYYGKDDTRNLFHGERPFHFFFNDILQPPTSRFKESYPILPEAPESFDNRQVLFIPAQERSRWNLWHAFSKTMSMIGIWNLEKKEREKRRRRRNKQNEQEEKQEEGDQDREHEEEETDSQKPLLVFVFSWTSGNPELDSKRTTAFSFFFRHILGDDDNNKNQNDFSAVPWLIVTTPKTVLPPPGRTTRAAPDESSREDYGDEYFDSLFKLTKHLPRSELRKFYQKEQKQQQQERENQEQGKEDDNNNKNSNMTKRISSKDEKEKNMNADPFFFTSFKLCFRSGIVYQNCFGGKDMKKCSSFSDEVESYSFGSFTPLTPQRFNLVNSYVKSVDRCLPLSNSPSHSSLPRVFFAVRSQTRRIIHFGLYAHLLRKTLLPSKKNIDIDNGGFVSEIVFGEPWKTSRADYLKQIRDSDIFIGIHGSAFTDVSLLGRHHRHYRDGKNSSSVSSSNSVAVVELSGQGYREECGDFLEEKQEQAAGEGEERVSCWFDKVSSFHKQNLAAQFVLDIPGLTYEVNSVFIPFSSLQQIIKEASCRLQYHRQQQQQQRGNSSSVFSSSSWCLENAKFLRTKYVSMKRMLQGDLVQDVQIFCQQLFSSSSSKSKSLSSLTYSQSSLLVSHLSEFTRHKYVFLKFEASSGEAANVFETLFALIFLHEGKKKLIEVVEKRQDQQAKNNNSPDADAELVLPPFGFATFNFSSNSSSVSYSQNSFNLLKIPFEKFLCFAFETTTKRRKEEQEEGGDDDEFCLYVARITKKAASHRVKLRASFSSSSSTASFLSESKKKFYEDQKQQKKSSSSSSSIAATTTRKKGKGTIKRQNTPSPSPTSSSSSRSSKVSCFFSILVTTFILIFSLLF